MGGSANEGVGGNRRQGGRLRGFRRVGRMSYTLAANILLYASDESSSRYGAGKEFLFQCAERTDVLYLPWMTVSAYLRIATHPRIFQRPPLPRDALANIESLISLPQVRRLSEGKGFGNISGRLSTR